MRSLTRSRFSIFLAGALLSGLAGCGGGDSGGNTVPTPPPASSGTGGSRPAAGGSGGAPGGSAGSGGSSTAGSGGSSTAGSGGGSSTGGAGGGMAGSGGAGGGSSPVDAGPPPPAGDAAPPAATTDWMGYPGVRDLSQPNPTEGCGKPAAIATNAWVMRMIMGIPAPMGQRDNPGDGNRRYFVRIPPNYDPNKRYKVVIATSSCVGGNQNVASMGDVPTVTNGAGGAILIAPIVEPGVWPVGSSEGCYDDKDPNSIEHPFLERFLDEVGRDFCYDKNKVFVQGHSSGGWYSNMVGCVHASDRIRAMSSNGGGIPNAVGERPRCSSKPMAGLWIHPQGDTEEPEATRRAVSRALVINKCEGAGTNPADEMVHQRVPSMNWSVAGSSQCKKYMCPEAFPVIFCTPPGTHGPVDWHSEAAWALFNSLP